MTPLLLLPGMMCDARLFSPQIDALSATRPLMVSPIGQHRTMRDLARAVLDDAPPRFALAGLSMGGIVAMEIVHQAPERVAGLALLDTNPLAERDEVKARRAGQLDAVKKGELARVMRDDMKPNYLADSDRRGAILELCMEMALALGEDVFVNQSLALRDRKDRTEALRRYAGPALVLCGRQDVLCPVERHELMHALLPDSRLHIVEGAGHLTTLEQPEETTGVIRDWLERI